MTTNNISINPLGYALSYFDFFHGTNHKFKT